MPTTKLPKKFAGKSTRVGKGGRAALLKSKLKAKGAKNPGALVGWIGRRKYGAAKMAKWSAAGRAK